MEYLSSLDLYSKYFYLQFEGKEKHENLLEHPDVIHYLYINLFIGINEFI